MTIKLPAPLAEGAGTALTHAGQCAICQRAILAGERYAVLVPAGKAAHLPCIGAHGRVPAPCSVIR
jgi:hypothetical protein